MVQDLEKSLNQAADLIVKSRRIIVFTGAGVSTESGIPDFRSPGGIWTRFNPDDFTYQKFITSAESRKKSWGLYQELWAMKADPNQAHYAIAELEKIGKLDSVITQNIDNLHQKAGSSPDKVIELHGNIQKVRCLDCGKRFTVAEIKKRLEQGEEIPDCDSCHGILKPMTISFGEAMPVREMQEAERRATNCDLCIVIGSTLIVYPAACIPQYAIEAGARLIIINLSSTPLDGRATVHINGKAGEIMPQLVALVKSKMKI